MEFDLTTTTVIFSALLLGLIAGTVTSPMPTGLAAGISVGLAVFGVATLVIGIKHGQYRAGGG